MRIENIGSSRNIPDSPQRPGLAEGDVLVAEVTDIKGDKVFLKNQEGGSVFTAKLLNDIGVAVGDYVETVVDEADGGRYVLRVIDVSHQSPFLTESGASPDASAMNQAVKTQTLLSTLAMLKNNPGADPKAAAFLSKHGIAGTAQNIESVVQMAKGYSPVTELLTKIIGGIGKIQNAAESGGQTAPVTDAAGPLPQAFAGEAGTTQPLLFDDAAASLQVLFAGDEAGGSVSGTTVQSSGQNPIQMIDSQVPLNSQTIPTNSADMALVNKTVLPAQNEAQPTALPQDAANVPPEKAQQPLSAQAMQVPTAENVDITRAQTNLQTAARLTVSTEPGLPQAAVVVEPDTGKTAVLAKAAILPEIPAEVSATAKPVAEELIPGSQTGTTPELRADSTKPAFIPALNVSVMEDFDATEPKNAELIQKALDMLVKIDDELAVHLKKVVKEMPEQLKELKLLAQDTDIKVREAVTQSLDRADKQLSIMSEVKRFDCYQIPLQTGPQQQDTAELFVYRYRGGKKSVDPDNIMILIGLDTQHMGRVETLVKTNGKSLGIEFNMEDMRLADEMRLDAATLKDTVQQAGFTLSGISVKELTSRTTVLNAEERFEKQADSSAGNLDIRV